MAASGNVLAERREQQVQFAKFAGTRQRKMSTISSRFEESLTRSGQTGPIFSQFAVSATLRKRECSRCDKAFYQSNIKARPKLYGTLHCRKRAQYERKNPHNRESQVCCECGIAFASDRKKKYCSVKCQHKGGRVPRHIMNCEACGTEYSSPYKRNRFCSIQCAGQNAGIVKACVDCGMQYHRRISKQTRCKTCQQRKRDLDQRIRFRFRHGKAKERPKGLSPRQIYNNSNGMCGICGDSIDWSLKWPHPMSMSVDHIVPLSRGGDDSESNLRASHLRCNCQRGSGN
jgi:hypothetical protein